MRLFTWLILALLVSACADQDPDKVNIAVEWDIKGDGTTGTPLDICNQVKAQLRRADGSVLAVCEPPGVRQLDYELLRTTNIASSCTFNMSRRER